MCVSVGLHDDKVESPQYEAKQPEWTGIQSFESHMRTETAGELPLQSPVA